MKIHLPVTCLVLLATSLKAQTVSFTQPAGSPITTNTSSLRGISSADLNSDGKKDFVVGNAYNTGLNVYLGSGNGQFTAAPGSPLAGSNGPISNTIADFNNDGKPDVATANYNTGNISVYLGTGTGSFTPASPATYATGAQPYWIEATDFNMDNNMDFVTVSANAYKAYVFLGAGNGTFSQATGSPYAVGVLPYHVATGLFNNDNFPDFAVANGNNANVSVFLGTGTGSFTPAPSSPYAVGTVPRTISVKDVNHDSRLDLIVANATSNNVSVLLGQANGSFTNAAGSPIATGQQSSYQTAIADYNSDGELDFAVTNANSNNLSVFLGNGTGSFTQATNSPISVGTNPQPICSDDFNNDGKADLLVGDFQSNKVTVLMNTNPVGIKEYQASHLVSIFPNPSVDGLTIKLDELKTGMEFILHNALGQEVDKMPLTAKETIYFRKQALSKGVYTFNIRYKNEILESGKVVFE